jgi:heat shock protein HslJ
VTEVGGNGPTATSDALAGSRWEIVAIDGLLLDAVAEPLLVTFGHDGRVSGSTGVNQVTASYTLTPDYVSFGPLASTRRAGSAEAMAQEQRVVASLAGMCTYRLGGRSLWIDGPLGRVELVEQTAPPAGDGLA